MAKLRLAKGKVMRCMQLTPLAVSDPECVRAYEEFPGFFIARVMGFVVDSIGPALTYCGAEHKTAARPRSRSEAGGQAAPSAKRRQANSPHGSAEVMYINWCIPAGPRAQPAAQSLAAVSAVQRFQYMALGTAWLFQQLVTHCLANLYPAEFGGTKKTWKLAQHASALTMTAADGDGPPHTRNRLKGTPALESSDACVHHAHRGLGLYHTQRTEQPKISVVLNLTTGDIHQLCYKCKSIAHGDDTARHVSDGRLGTVAHTPEFEELLRFVGGLRQSQ